MSNAAKIDETDSPGTAATGVIRQVLVVDDSRAQLRLMTTMLTRWDLEVHEASSAQEALDILNARPIDLVLSDWVMPGMDGLDLCRAFRAQNDGRYVYFILLTSKSEAGDVAMGLAAGADDFLSKPIDKEELRARISAGERLIATQRALESKNGQLAGALDELQTLYDSLARDLVEARRLQQSLVPKRSISFSGTDISLLLRPSGHVGGDLVGAFALREGIIGVYSLDVSGHGIASALMTARLAGYLSDSARERNVALRQVPDIGYIMRPPEEACKELNRLMNDDNETDLYFTMALAACDMHTGKVVMAQAGHPNPLVQRADGTVEFIGSGGMPIGLIDGAAFGTLEVSLEPGDRLFLYSDGFVEQTDPEGNMLDEAGLSRIASRHAAVQGEAFLESLVWSLSDHAGDAEFADDVSGVLLEFHARLSEE